MDYPLMNNTYHIMTCDLEDWYHPSLVGAPFEKWKTFESRIDKTTDMILNLFRETHTQATFFVLGYVAEQFPEVIAKIARHGHEIASHSYQHKLVYDMTPEAFQKDTEKAVSILKGITGKAPKGYRAPSWSTSIRLEWYWEILRDMGFKYDSSLYPYKTFLYGDNSNPRTPYRLEKYGLFEIPPSVGEVFSKRIPYAGGFFLRALPSFFIHTFIRQYDRMGSPAVLYFHPWELDPGIPKQKLGLKNNFITYVNIGRFQKKIKKLSQTY
ncbi:MAG: DUF3473 domain-containing protein, partial [Calditrichaeota bacterium]|nr:DUF3473 domain-containing protein [Calditrichota bacterium]